MSCNIPSPETPQEYLPPRYFKRISGAAGGAFREIVTPPKLAPSLRLSLTRDIEGKRAMAHLHPPGDGWHYLPTRAEYVHNGSYWFSTLGTSEGPILANVADLCDEIGVAFEALFRKASRAATPPRTRLLYVGDPSAGLELRGDVDKHASPILGRNRLEAIALRELVG